MRDEVHDIASQVYLDQSARTELVRNIEVNGTVKDFESTAVQRDGSEITICEHVRAVQDLNGKVLFYEGSVENVTQRRLAEDLQRHREAADARDRAKSSFLANMSHEIRTPLNGIIGMLELLSRTILDDRQTRFVRVANSSAGSLLHLINEILDFSKIEAGKLELEKISFDLRILLEDVTEMFGHQAAEKELELTCFVRPDVPNRVIGDPERLRQILINLVGNALKFTESGEIRVEASSEPDTSAITLSVSDTGIGIPIDRQTDLFAPFSQLDASTTRKFGGTGLGLAICGQLAELMGGEMSVDGEPGMGSTFACSVPLPPADDIPEPAVSSHTLAGVRVIAVDDNETNREILFEQLTAWGIEVDVFSDPESALIALKKNIASDEPYQLAILDQHMPNMAGVQLVSEIRRKPELKDLRVALLSSVDDVIDPLSAAQIGIQATMTKPIRQSRLFDVLVNLLHDRQPTTSPTVDNGQLEMLSESRVLVAEDNDVNQLVVREILKELGVDCEIVGDGAQAVKLLREERFDAVLMDCQMPVMDGFEVTRTIRDLQAQDELADRQPIRIIALTANANAVSGDRERCLDAGMDDYVTKPIDPAILRSKLARAFAARTDDVMPNGTMSSKKDVDDAANDLPVSSASVPAPAEMECGESSAESRPTLRIDELEARCLGNIDIVEQVLRKFQSRLPEEVDGLRVAAQSGDLEEIRRLSHSLKGSAGNVSAAAISDHASAIESAFHLDDLDAIQIEIESLSASVDDCLSDVTGILEGLPLKSGAPSTDKTKGSTASEN